MLSSRYNLITLVTLLSREVEGPGPLKPRQPDHLIKVPTLSDDSGR